MDNLPNDVPFHEPNVPQQKHAQQYEPYSKHPIKVVKGVKSVYNKINPRYPLPMFQQFQTLIKIKISNTLHIKTKIKI